MSSSEFAKFRPSEQTASGPELVSAEPGKNVAAQWTKRRLSTFSRRLLLAAAISLFILLSVRALVDLRANQSSAGWVEHTHEVLATADGLLGNVRDVETGQRGFLLTGENQYLEPYKTGIAALPQLQRALRKLTADNPHQQTRCRELDQLIHLRLALAERTITVRQSEGPEAALALIRTGMGKRAMDAIRGVIQAVKDEEYRLLDTRQRRFRALSQSHNLLTFLVAGLLTIVSAAAFAFIEADIIERQRLEKSLRSTERRLGLALEAGRSGTFDFDPEQNVTLWSKELSQLYGFPSAAAEKTLEEWLACVHPDDRSLSLAAIEEALRTGHLDLQFRIRKHDDGTIRWLQGQGQILFDEEAQASRMVGVNVDITEGKRTEEALQAREERLALAKAAAHIGIWDWDVPGDTVTSSSEYHHLYGRFEEITDFGLDEWLACVHPEDRERAAHEVQRSLADDAPYDSEYRVVWPDGSVHWLFGKGKVFRDKHGQPIRMLGVNYDVTERKTAEHVLERQAAQLRESNAALERFAHSVSHDLKEPLRTMSLYAELLRRTYDGRLDGEADEFIKGIAHGVSRMSGLITGLMQYARAGYREGLGEQHFPLEDSLQRAMENLRASIAESSATITHDPLPTIVGEPLHTAQIFQNLLSNALKYRRPDAAPNVHVTAERKEREWVISVRDQGIGFEAHQAKRIFDIFQRLHTKEYEGAGVGLAICKRMVEQAGGRIWAEGTPGQGATFLFTVPARDGTRTATASST